MGVLKNAFLGLCGFLVASCNSADENHFTIEELTQPEMLQAEDIRVRWLSTILHTMQGETGTNLKIASAQHGIEIGFADNLDHALGVYDPASDRVTLEVPYGLSEETFDELVLTGRKVMYHEMDHGVRDQSGHNITGLSFEYQIDGAATTHEAIADITAFIGMSEDAQIGSAPSLAEQFGVPESGHAVYYAPIPAPMADVILAGLEEGEYFHEDPELIDQTFAAFFNSGRSEEYTLRYGSVIPENVLNGYRSSTPLDRVFQEYGSGRSMTFNDLNLMTEALFSENDDIAPGLEDAFANGEFTSEAERLTVRDLLRKQAILGRPDGGPANHLVRQRSFERISNFFAEAPASEIIRQFEVIPQNAQTLLTFYRGCQGKDYISPNNQNFIDERVNFLTQSLPVFRDAANSILDSIRGQTEFSAGVRVQLESAFQQIHGPISRLDGERMQLFDMYGPENRGSSYTIACRP